jgi:cellobiose-specific phosphotransferase system component IIC
MTDYELVDTFYTIASLADQLIASFVTLLFAFLVASYLASSKLDRRMVVIIISLYSFMALRYIALYYRVTDDIGALGRTLTEIRLEQGSSLDWLEISSGMWWATAGTSAAMLLCYLASIFFFFYTRHRGNE